MLLFIVSVLLVPYSLFLISIHLMLLFIHIEVKPTHTMADFNTSHVTVYPEVDHIIEIKTPFQYISCYCLSCSGRMVRATIHISIHLMLLFIPFCIIPPLFHFKFQYISCYCLSMMPLTRSQPDWYFNTSHVTVYH